MSESNVAFMSASIAKLADALSKAQRAMRAASKDRTNPHFRSKYADLASVMDAVREPLTDNGLAFVQRVTSDSEGVKVITTLMHSSGEYISDECWLPVPKKDPQGYGSAITYARRYSLSAMVGVAADDDDDGNTAARPATPPAPSVKKAEPAPFTGHMSQLSEIDPAIDYFTAIENASSKEELDKLVPEIKKLSDKDVVSRVRKAFVERTAALVK